MKTSLSIRSANLLYLLTMLLVITLGSAMQLLNLSVGLIATEVLLILLPTLVFLKRQGIPFKEGLGLIPIRPRTALVSLLLGFTVFLISIYIEAVMATLTGMAAVPTPASSLPSGPLESAVYLIALAVFAPLCEETLFRGTLQPAYANRKSARFAITLTAFLFAFYHFRLSGLPGLLPAAFVLGYVAWRTRSIYASMLVHLGLNATSAAHTLVALYVNGTGLPFLSPWFALAGLLGTAALLLLLRRLHPAPETTPALPGASPRRSWLHTYWPLTLAGLLYLGVAGLTLWSALTPASRASADLQYFRANFEHPIHSRYQLTDPGGGVVGEMNCIFTPSASILGIDCQSSVEGYEVTVANGYYKDATHTADWSATWDAATLDLLSYSFERNYTDGTLFSASYQDGQLKTNGPDGPQEIALDPAAYLEYEWPWRSDLLLTNAGDVWKIPFGWLQHWDETQKKSSPAVVTETLQVSADQPLSIPAGDFTVRKFTLARQSAWYARDDAGLPRPVQFDDGMLTYSLMQ